MDRIAILECVEDEYRPLWRTEYEFEKKHERWGVPKSPSVIS